MVKVTAQSTNKIFYFFCLRAFGFERIDRATHSTRQTTSLPESAALWDVTRCPLSDHRKCQRADFDKEVAGEVAGSRTESSRKGTSAEKQPPLWAVL